MENQVKQYKQDKLNTLDIKQPTKTLKTLKVFTMIAKVISMIVFVFAIIGFVAGITLSILAITQKDVIYTNTQTFGNYFWATYKISVYSLSMHFVMGAIVCAGAIAVAWLAWKWFGDIYRKGTPFTYKTGRDGIRLAIVCGGTLIAGAIIWGIFAIVYQYNFGKGVGAEGFNLAYAFYPFWTKLIFGIIYLVLAFIFRHGAQVREMNYARVNPEQVAKVIAAARAVRAARIAKVVRAARVVRAKKAIRAAKVIRAKKAVRTARVVRAKKAKR